MTYRISKELKLNTGFKFIVLVFLLITNLSLRAQVRAGQKAPEIALPNPQGQTIKLSSFLGNVVLIDFWASWCVPCRKANPKVVKLYNKYKDKGLVIMGVSLDEEKSDWLTALKKDKIDYVQVLDGGGWQAKTAEKYGVEAIPATFLIDKNGTIVAIDLEGEELENKIKSLL